MGQLIRRLWAVFHLVLLFVVYKTFKAVQKTEVGRVNKSIVAIGERSVYTVKTVPPQTGQSSKILTELIADPNFENVEYETKELKNEEQEHKRVTFVENGAKRDFKSESIQQTGSPETKLVILVLSSRKSFIKRQAIRETWAKNHTNVFFMVGRDFCRIPIEYRLNNLGCSKSNPDVTITKAVLQAHISMETYTNDQLRKEENVVLLDMVDTYRNLPEKLRLGLKWIVENRRKSGGKGEYYGRFDDVRFVMKADDDMFVRVASLSHHLMDNFEARSNLVIGEIRAHQKTQTTGKWAEKVFKEEHYPTYAVGSAGYTMV